MLVIGHSGAPRRAPGGTLPSLNAAFDRGADGVFVSVSCAPDGRLAVHGEDNAPSGLHLDEVLAALGARPLCVEAKGPDAALAAAAALTPGVHVLASFSSDALAAAAQAAPGLRRGLMVGESPWQLTSRDLSPWRALEDSSSALLIAERHLLGNLGSDAGRRGVQLWLWNFPQPGDAIRLLEDPRVQGLIVSDPDKVAAVRSDRMSASS